MVCSALVPYNSGQIQVVCSKRGPLKRETMGLDKLKGEQEETSSNYKPKAK